MAKTFIFIAVITSGILIAMQGMRVMRSRNKPSVLPPERVLMSVFAGHDIKNQMRVLGRLRVVIGIFLVVIGIWAMS